MATISYYYYYSLTYLSTLNNNKTNRAYCYRETIYVIYIYTVTEQVNKVIIVTWLPLVIIIIIITV